MKLTKYYRREIVAFRVFKDKEVVSFKYDYRNSFIVYELDLKELTKQDIEEMKRYKDGTHKLILIVTEDNKFIRLETEKRAVKRGKSIMKYVEKPYIPINYVNYHDFGLYTQLDGITVIVGMSGGGKTYSALAMLNTYSLRFNKIAYLNYELTENDIIHRLNDMHIDLKAKKRIYDALYIHPSIMTNLDLEQMLADMDVMPEDKVCFIIDNVGSVTGQEENVYLKQNQFLKELDVLAKERGFHVLALTQMVKDHSMKIFDETSGEILDSVNYTIMSGSIVLGNLSRSVLFTAYNSTNGSFKKKILKKGTGKFYSEAGGAKTHYATF